MLPAQLLRVRVYGEYIKPIYAELSHENLYLAENLIDIFRSSVGKKVKDLEDDLNEAEIIAEHEGYDYRFIRGLITLLNRRLNIKKPSFSYDPLMVRLEIFKIVNQLYRGFVINSQERNNVLTLVAEKINTRPEEINNAFKSVYEEENLIESFQEITAEDLIKLYNLSLTQTLLFKCVKLIVNIKTSGQNARKILWDVKRNNLLYMAEKIDDSVRIIIDGPISVIKQTERYGTNLAKTLPSIISADHWNLEALIARRAKLRGKHFIYKFILDDQNRHMYPQQIENIITYDSSLEEDFHKRFIALKSDWNIIREPEPLVSGSRIFIPDFVFIRNGEKVYLEIVGFWTKDYIKRKIEKLKELKDIKIIIAIDESIDEFKLEDTSHIIIKFKRSLPSYEVLKILNSLAPKSKLDVESEKLRSNRIEITNINLDGMTLLNAIRVLKSHNIDEKDIESVLESLGYSVDWNTLDPSQVIVKRKNKT